MKRYLLIIYKKIINLYYEFFSSNSSDTLKISFAGARAGNVGGTLVKVKRLSERFKKNGLGYNLLYCLSNTAYLSKHTLQIIKERNIPIVHNQNGVFYKAWYDGDCDAKNKAMTLSYHMADYVFYQSKFCKKASDKFLGERKGDFAILYNAVNTKQFVPEKCKKTPGDTIKILMTGKLVDYQFYRVECVLKALKQLVGNKIHYSLCLAGWMSAGLKEKVLALVSSLGLESFVMLIPYYTQDEAPALYQSADMYINTQHQDNCPNAVIEAMSCGLPVIYANSGGVPELVADAGIALDTHENWEFPVIPTAQNIAESIESVILNHAEFSEKARARAVQYFDIEHWYKKHEEIFYKLLEQRCLSKKLKN